MPKHDGIGHFERFFSGRVRAVVALRIKSRVSREARAFLLLVSLGVRRCALKRPLDLALTGE